MRETYSLHFLVYSVSIEEFIDSFVPCANQDNVWKRKERVTGDAYVR